MDIRYRIGNVLDTDCAVLLHGCNMQGVFNAGVAKAIRERFPFAYLAYRETYLARALRLGEVVWAIDTEQTRIVANAITQEFYGPGGQRYVSYDAVREAIRAVDALVARTQRPNDDDGIDIAGITPITMVAMPLVGAGLGGGNWNEIATILEEDSHHFTPVVYQLNP